MTRRGTAIALSILIAGCSSATSEGGSNPSATSSGTTDDNASTGSESGTESSGSGASGGSGQGASGPSEDSFANVTAVTAEGNDGAFNVSVTIESPDTGCDAYANWWEVVTEDGELRYRRILAHSHVDEQPFTRSGGPVPIQGTETVIVRAHFDPTGYGGTAMRGSPQGGFVPAPDIDASFAPDLAQAAPQPDGCAF